MAHTWGVASNANLLNLRVLNKQGNGSVSSVLGALNWLMANRQTYNVRVVNMSLGMDAIDSYRDDPVCKAVRSLADVGVVVVAAAGNSGKNAAGQKVYGQVHSPGIEPSAITVGATNTFGTDSRADDAMASYSSHGPTRSYYTDNQGGKHYDNLIKPDLVAPGNKIVAAKAVNNLLSLQNPLMNVLVSLYPTRAQMRMNGSSMATPAAAGAAALLFQANPKLTPNMVKSILMYTAQPLAGFNMFEQGAGQLNIEGAVRLAKLVRTDLSATTTVGSPMLTAALPTAQSTIAGQTFSWSQGLILGHNYIGGSGALLVTGPIIGIIYLTYRTYLKNVKTAELQTEQARTHVEELNRYILQQERIQEQFSQVEKLSALGQLASGVAHDFNNSLASILGRSELMMKHTEDPQMRRGLEIIAKSARDGAKTVKRIQDFARQRSEHDFELVDVDQMLLDVSEITRPRWRDGAEAKNVHINLELKNHSGAHIRGDVSELRDVLVNMIFNAVHAMPIGGHLTLAAELVDDHVLLSVIDTGVGMPPEVRSRVFDPFFTTKGVEGMGLGLAVGYGVVRRHQGTFEVESELGVGSAFRIKIPVAALDSAAHNNQISDALNLCRGQKWLES